jgi:hypothetical protein
MDAAMRAAIKREPSINEEQIMDDIRQSIAAITLVLIFAVFPVYAGTDKPSSSDSLTVGGFQQRELSRSAIKKALQQVAQEELRHGNGKTTGEGRDLLNDMLAGAAARVFAVPDVSPSQQVRLEKAEQSTRKLIQTALNNANSPKDTKGRDQKVKVTEDAIREAWKLCPFYPFC